MRADPHPLDQPPWAALTTTHAGFAFGNALACRYQPQFAPLAGLREPSDLCLDALAALTRPGDVVALFGVAPAPAGGNLALVDVKTVEQMVHVRGDDPPPVAGEPVRLGEADVPAMMRLVALTKPGPFAVRTIALGSYIGMRSADGLVAMAGERMRFDGFTEISAVCTHPDHRGRGHAAVLVRALTGCILARGETPFLHVFTDNTAAAALYAKLGFARRRTLTVSVLKSSGRSGA